MTAANTTVLELLGKQVSFTYVTEWAELPKKGTVTYVVLSLNSEPEILIDDGDFISMSEIRDFKLVE
ncbi:hypothetical protein [Acinetobacter baumannii]|uniref:hypothetical protein n=1 Tax=Acinetobacter baumannii TaxID=470 RepID=UPI000D6E7297|nr:hypothetical protein [Acinetobacter baumannii]